VNDSATARFMHVKTTFRTAAIISGKFQVFFLDFNEIRPEATKRFFALHADVLRQMPRRFTTYPGHSGQMDI
jgi:hypothetical protein